MARISNFTSSPIRHLTRLTLRALVRARPDTKQYSHRSNITTTSTYRQTSITTGDTIMKSDTDFVALVRQVGGRMQKTLDDEGRQFSRGLRLIGPVLKSARFINLVSLLITR